MFGTWVITSETAAPWIGLAANALGTWDFLVNAINDYRHVKQAEKIIHHIKANPAFSSEQIQLAAAKLKEWREAKLQHR